MMRALHDPYRTLIDAFNRHGVRYLVVGMAGINYYAQTPAQTFATMDYDLFVEPTLKNINQTLRCLTRLGFSVGTSAGLLKGEHVRAVVRKRSTIVATTSDGLMVELLLAVSGFTYSGLARDAATFTIRGIPVKVGRLTKLLRSKQIADRPKDRQFLRRYQSLLKEQLQD